MAHNTLSDPVVTAAFWTGAGALLLTIVLSLQILRLRIGLRRRERVEQCALDKWRPVLHAALVGEQPELPALAASERLPFLKLWVHLQGSLRGEVADALNDIARRLGVDASARALLQRGRRAEKLLAVLTLGHLRDRAAWPQLLQLATQSDRTLALTALWALVHIDPRAAAGHIVPLFVERDDWSLARVAAILQEAGAPATEALARLLPELPEARLPRALRLAEALRMTPPLPVLQAALRSDRVPVLVAALRGIFTPEALDLVRALLAHTSWEVRVQAARALGRIGQQADIARLAPLLADREWWVRYRAAQALAELSVLHHEPLDVLRDGLTDRYARDMLAQVLAEKGIA